jgi:hypothetical protein
LARGGAERQLRPREARDSPATAEINAPAGSQDEKFTLIAASDEYFSNLAKQGKDPKTISSYRSHIDPFVRTCKKLYVEDVTKQDMIDFMDFLRKQPVVPRLHGNPARTIANRILAVGIFLKVFGKTGLLTKHERPKDHTKTIVAHTDEELSLLYAHDTGEETFLLDFFLGSMVRDGRPQLSVRGFDRHDADDQRKAAQDPHPGNQPTPGRRDPRTRQAQRQRIFVPERVRQVQ